MKILRLVFLAVLADLGLELRQHPRPPQPCWTTVKVDLIPLPAAGFCQNGGQFLVVIRNQDAAKADASTTRVTFSRGSAVDLATPEIDGGRIVTLDPITIPAECFAPDCVVTVTVRLSKRCRRVQREQQRRRGTLLSRLELIGSSGPIGKDDLHGSLFPMLVKRVIARLETDTVGLLEMSTPMRRAAVYIREPVLIGQTPGAKDAHVL